MKPPFGRSERWGKPVGWPGEVRRLSCRSLRTIAQFLLPVIFSLLAAAPGSPAPRHHKHGVAAFAEILARMNDSAKHLKSLTTNLEYTTVTVLVDDKSTQYGELFYRKDKKTEILIKFEKPDPKVILFKRNKAEIYNPKINQIQEYDVEPRGELVQQFLLLGFGTEVADLKKSYDLKLVDEEEIQDDTAAVLELTPLRKDIAGQLSKVELWISEDSWLPVQQKFFQPGGDYLVARYSGTKVNRDLPASTFQIDAAGGAKRVRMN
jgi:outer membrane lipoprotein-sorting protein